MSFLNSTKHFLRDLIIYPKYKKFDKTYDSYWQSRDISIRKFNDFQKYRAEFAGKFIKDNDSVMDIGCGDGSLLKYLKDN